MRTDRQIYLQEAAKYLFVMLAAALGGALIALRGVSAAGMLVGIPIMIGFIFLFFYNPKVGIYAALTQGFLISFLGRYVPSGIPYGLVVDFLLVLTFVVILFKYWRKIDITPARNEVVLLMALWMGYIILQIANPNAPSRVAWFYAMRGIALYQLLIMALCFLLFNSKKDIYRFLNIWFGFSIVAILWALKQKFIGVDPWEQRWLDAGAATTHLLFGKLRVFSFYSDAGTFGAAMGHLCITAFVLFMGPYNMRRRIFYLILGLFATYSMIISGTRGALAVPGAGGIAYLIMTKNSRILIPGFIVIAAAFSFLKFTTIGNGNYDINRLRSALNADDPSLQARIKNRAALTNYLSDKPFGGGVGTVGSWGERFSPHTWLGQFPPDGLYTRIRAETGIVGRNFYVWMWVYILLRGIWFTWNFKDKERQYLSMAILSGYAGILLSNYGNPVMTQFPTSLLVYVGLTFVYSMRYWNEDGEFEKPWKEPKDRSFHRLRKRLGMSSFG